MKKIEIKGKNGTSKEYVPVNERVIAFRKEHPEWTLETVIEEMKEGFVLMRASVRDKEGRLLSSAYAYENEGATFINRTSYIENCETSAIGRALGFLGYGIDTSIASFEEVANAMNQETSARHTKKTKKRKSNTEQFNIVKKAVDSGVLTGGQVKKMIQKKGGQTFKGLSYEDAESIVDIVRAMMNDVRKEEEDEGQDND